VVRVFDMLIDKPGGTVHETPWHQDVSYFRRPAAPKGTSTVVDDVQVWLALDEPLDTSEATAMAITGPNTTTRPRRAYIVNLGSRVVE
jgi:hypothetical protein